MALPLVLLVATTCAAREIYESPWLEVRTPHFDIFSQPDRDGSLAAAGKIEKFRSIFKLITGIKNLNDRTPNYIYILDSRNDEFHLTRDIGGYLVPSLRASYAVVCWCRGFGLDTALLHETGR